MKIDVNKLDEFMNIVNAKVDPDKDSYDQEFAALADTSRQAITQYNVEVKMGMPQQMAPATWVEARAQFGWPQRLWRLYEAYEKQEADKEAKGGDNELLNEVKELRAQMAKLLEVQSAPAEEKPAESTEETETKPENATEKEEDAETEEKEGETEEAPEEEA